MKHMSPGQVWFVSMAWHACITHHFGRCLAYRAQVHKRVHATRAMDRHPPSRKQRVSVMPADNRHFKDECGLPKSYVSRCSSA